MELQVAVIGQVEMNTEADGAFITVKSLFLYVSPFSTHTNARDICISEDPPFPLMPSIYPLF